MKIFAVMILLFAASLFSQTTHENKQNEKMLRVKQSSVLNLEFDKMALSKSGVLYLGGKVVATRDEKGNVIEPSGILLATVKSEEFSVQRLPEIGRIRSIYLMDGELAVVSGIHKNLRTSDGGETWESFPNPPNIFTDLFFLNRKSAWFNGDDSKDEEGNSAIFRWNDGSSENIAKVDGFPYYRKFYFATDNIGWAISVKDEKASFLSSKDGGRTWIDRTRPQDETMDFQFFDSRSGYVLRKSGLYATTDGARDLSPVGMPKSNAIFRQIFFLDVNTGWLVGKEICTTQNGGDVWDCWPNDEYGHNQRYYLIAFQDAEKGWKLTKDGLFSTSDGGRSWKHFPITVGAYSF